MLPCLKFRGCCSGLMTEQVAWRPAGWGSSESCFEFNYSPLFHFELFQSKTLSLDKRKLSLYFSMIARSVICDSRHFKQGSNYLSLTILPTRPLGNQVSCCSLVNGSSCTVCKVPVGKLVCRLTESFTYTERNSWQRRQPCFQPAAHETCIGSQ